LALILGRFSDCRPKQAAFSIGGPEGGAAGSPRQGEKGCDRHDPVRETTRLTARRGRARKVPQGLAGNCCLAGSPGARQTPEPEGTLPAYRERRRSKGFMRRTDFRDYACFADL